MSKGTTAFVVVIGIGALIWWIEARKKANEGKDLALNAALASGSDSGASGSVFSH